MTEAARDMPDEHVHVCVCLTERWNIKIQGRTHMHAHLFISRNTWKLSVPFFPWCHRDLYVSESGNVHAHTATQINRTVWRGRIFRDITMPLLSHSDRDQGQNGQKAQLLCSSSV